MEDKDSFFFRINLKDTSWYLVGQYYLTIFDKDRKKFLYEKIYILIIISITTIFIAFLLSYYFTSSLNKMNRLLKKLGIDNMDIVFPEDKTISEISELGTAFNEMILRTESLLDQLLISTKKQNELETKKKDAEMTALQAQINPHFLYNTIESINCLIRDGDRQNAIKMLTSLSDLFRFISRTDNVIVPISEELEYVKTYAEIMQMRFGENLTFQWDLSQDLLTCKTIKLILQPVIENAIYHGIKPKQSHGIINVKCTNTPDGILFSISDNGIGMDEESLVTLTENLNSEKYLNRIGLYNVQNRIRLFFGKQYGLKIESKYGEGAIVEIHIPRITS